MFYNYFKYVQTVFIAISKRARDSKLSWVPTRCGCSCAARFGPDAVSLCARGVCLPSLLLCRCVPVVSVCPLSYAVSLCARGVSLPPLLLLVLRARGALSALSAGAGAGAGVAAAGAAAGVAGAAAAAAAAALFAAGADSAAAAAAAALSADVRRSFCTSNRLRANHEI